MPLALACVLWIGKWYIAHVLQPAGVMWHAATTICGPLVVQLKTPVNSCNDITWGSHELPWFTLWEGMCELIARDRDS